MRTGPKNQGKRVLFVDDDRNILNMLERMLRQANPGWEAIFCQSVDEALKALEQRTPDAVVTDIRMPGKDGFDLIDEMRVNGYLHKIPVVILTGENDRTLKRRALDCGATDLLNKPVTREDLIARVRSVLRIKDYEDRLQDQVALLDGLVRERTQQLELSHREVVWRLAKAGEFRDDETGNHVARVAWCSCALGEAVGMGPGDVELILQTSPLHDIGKIGVPDSILLKPGPLTELERAVMQQHTLIGEDILRSAPKTLAAARTLATAPLLPDTTPLPSPLLAMASTIARSHHEKWNGRGYPDGLKGEDIPIEARIVAVADVYDALLSERPYKKAMSRTDALTLMREQSDTHFDPRVLGAFMDQQPKVEQAYVRFAQLTNGGVETA